MRCMRSSSRVVPRARRRRAAAARAINAQMQPPLWAALLGLSAASAQSTSGGAADARRQHNVLYFVADDLRPEIAAPGYGQRQVITPSIDALARAGLTFVRAYCQQAVCGASFRTQVWDTDLFPMISDRDFWCPGFEFGAPASP
eukprot:SAG31_NODE_1367_length_8615_cov_12.875763_10_plen_144_part_00